MIMTQQTRQDEAEAAMCRNLAKKMSHTCSMAMLHVHLQLKTHQNNNNDRNVSSTGK